MAAAEPVYPTLKIIKAVYGFTEAKKHDATHKLQQMQKEAGGSLTIEKKANMNMLFGDPEPKTDKKLTITYQYGEGEVLTEEYPENNRETNIVFSATDKPTDKMYGRMTLTVHKAQDLKDVESFGAKMDPYYKLTCGGENFTSKISDKAHSNPVWDQQHILNLEGVADTMRLTFYDKNTLRDAAIGRVDIPLGMISANPGSEQWFNITEIDNMNKPAGKVLVSGSFRGRGGPRPPKAVTTNTAAAPAAQPEVVYVTAPPPGSVPIGALPVGAVPVGAVDLKSAPAVVAHGPAAPQCVCDKGHAMVHHDSDKCAFLCTGCNQQKAGSAGGHYQCQTCMTYWLCGPCSTAAISNGYSPSAPLTAPLCSKNHACIDFTGKKPAGYHNEFKCDVCAKQYPFGPGVKFWHCSTCSYDICFACGDKYLHAAAPAFKKVSCAKNHRMMPGWNKTPAAAKAQIFECAKCKGKKRYAPAHDYYTCASCFYNLCSDCVNTAAGVKK